VVVQRSDRFEVDACVNRLGLPLVVKPVGCGSSVGMSIVKAADDLNDAVAKAFFHDEAILIETYIQGLELTAGVIGNNDLEALPLIEIIPDQQHEFFDYEAKYTAGVTQEICPAGIDAELTARVQTYAKQAHQVLFCKGYSRTDMILKDGEIYVLETNTIPGMTANSLLPRAAKAAGMSFSRLLDKLITLSLENRDCKR
jgi:D-alanine-D-alanine ligase